MRLEQEVDIFGDAEIIRRLQANETSISVLQGNISALISASELTELQNSHTTMYSQLASLKLTVNSMDLEFSDLRTEFNAVSGQYTELDSKVAQYKASVDGLSISITEVQQNLVDNYSTTSAVTAAINAKANEIELSVSGNYPKKDQIISAINLSPEDVSISASKINLNGVVTANNYFKILSDGSMETIRGKIGGWTIDGNQLICNTSDFYIRIQAPTVYGTFGNGLADVITVRDIVNDSHPFVLSSDGTLVMGSEFHYSPQGFSDEPNSMLRVGGWQIKKTYDYLGYDEITYWDTPSSQENGICAKGPWVVWGGWNGAASADVANYKFVVTDQGVCKAMSWVTGSRAEWKENIVPYGKSAVQEIMNSDVYYYDLKNQSKSAWQEGRHIGFVIGDGYNVSSDILDGGGSSIDMYSALAVAYKAIQELQAEIEALKKRIEEVTA